MAFVFSALPRGDARRAVTHSLLASACRRLRCALPARRLTDALVRGVRVVFGGMLRNIPGHARIRDRVLCGFAVSAEGALLLGPTTAALARTERAVFMLARTATLLHPTTWLAPCVGLARIVPLVVGARILWKGFVAVFV